MKNFYILLLFLSAALSFSAQSLQLKELENEVYKHNRKGEHRISQKKILDLLKNNNLSNENEAELYILLASTYRSLNDYPTCIEYLLQAQNTATYLNPKDSLISKINSQLSFAYFDDNQYKESGRIMKLIRKNGFSNISQQDKAYLIMQEGYLHYLNKNYSVAQQKYQESKEIIKKTSPCDAPVIMVKEMQMYSAMNDLVKAEEIYHKALQSAEECGVLKYKLYATEELKNIYQNHNIYDKAVFYGKVLDSLKIAFKRDDTVSMLHNESQNYIKKQKEELEKSNLIKTIIYIISSVLFILLVYYFYKKSAYHKKEKERLDAELNQMKKELKAFTEYQYTHQTSAKEQDIKNLEKLNKRQKEFLKYMMEGLSNKEIAEKLFITEATVKYHIKNIYEILELKNRRDFFAKLSKK